MNRPRPVPWHKAGETPLGAGTSLNLLELKPIRNVSWDGDAGGRVHLLAPRFGTSLLSWLGVLLRRPTFRVRLDDFGSFVWLRCDGATTVQQIAEALQRQ